MECDGRAQRRHRRSSRGLPKRRGASLPAAVQNGLPAARRAALRWKRDANDGQDATTRIRTDSNSGTAAISVGATVICQNDFVMDDADKEAFEFSRIEEKPWLLNANASIVTARLNLGLRMEDKLSLVRIAGKKLASTFPQPTSLRLTTTRSLPLLKGLL